MGSKLSKRLSQLEYDAKNSGGRFRGFLKYFVVAFCALAVLCLMLGSLTGSSTNPDEPWRVTVDRQVISRIHWLDETIFFGSGRADSYYEFARFVVTFLGPEVHPKNGQLNSDSANEPLGSIMSDFQTDTQEVICNSLLRIGFVIIAFWPIWLLTLIISYFVGKKITKPNPTEDILGICNPGKGPFYSGIYGPLRANHKLSGTDYSCPSLATPKIVPRGTALSHRLVSTLKKFNAFNETNINLVQTILAYKDYPSFVEYENPAEIQDTDLDSFNPSKFDDRASKQNSFITNEAGTIEKSAIDGLDAILKAHRVLKNIVEKSTHPLTFEKYNSVRLALNEENSKAAQLPPLAKILLSALTAKRAQEIAEISPTIIASAYLAIEAGKSLVYNRAEGKFVRISRFPHLQARAVIQSIVSYHKEYDGEIRLLIRQAIICSRRHGDFGRAFLPMRMPVASRAIRDWLEILYSPNVDRENVGNLVELDGHVEELHQNWREHFLNFIKKPSEPISKEQSDRNGYPVHFTKGVVYKSVVLIPLQVVLELAWRNFSSARRSRISELITSTKDLRDKLSVSARLPGFKRQGTDAEQSNNTDTVTNSVLAKRKNNDVLEKWTIVRRMLNRYNWLSTRVGDDPVPNDSLTQAVAIDRKNASSPEVVGLEALVPIRQRRLKDLFGTSWERHYFKESPHPRDIEVFVQNTSFEKELKEKQKLASEGKLNGNTEREGAVFSG